ncbi:hypothetical protein HKX48_008506 [Thoreauomyces humboldtii]|nr:hypothetical protein HKX48_008506 [Thoreauomyces humboldtii]
MFAPVILLPSLLLLLSSAVLPVLAAEDADPSTAQLVFPTTPITSTVWVAGQQSPITWTLPDGYPTAVTDLTIELGVGQNTTVEGSGIFVSKDVPYPATLTLNYVVPANLTARQYCLIFTGKSDSGTVYGPNYATWFTVNAAGTAAASIPPVPSSVSTPATVASAATVAAAASTPVVAPSSSSSSSVAGAAATQAASAHSGAASLAVGLLGFLTASALMAVTL